MISEETRQRMRESALSRGQWKSCPECGESDRQKFYLDKNGNKSNARCKECHKAYCKKNWHSKTREQKQASRVRAMYGIEPEQYLKMYNDQKGCCAICGEEPSTQRGLHLDHCHETGKVRGLLCHGCNVGIGSLRDDPDILKKALDYLKEV